MSRLPVVAVVGRPNVGKSTLVNRILRRRAAVVEARPGVTRDRKQFEAEWAGVPFIIVDTGGWEVRGEGLIEGVRAQVEAALSAADVVLLVVDARTPVDIDDEGIARILRRAGVPCLLVANKVDGPKDEADLDRLWKLGLGPPIGVSALHGRNTGDLLDRLLALLPEAVPAPERRDDLPTLAIVGRPNVGKSTLLNRLVGEERVLVSPEPGTTRDAVDEIAEIDGRRYRLVDTAGIRRAARVKEPTEYYSVLRAHRALARADVALLVVDAVAGLTHQEQRIADEIIAAGAGAIVLLNKWDAVSEEEREATEDGLADRLAFISWAPVLRISALTGARLKRLGEAIETVLENRARRIPTPELNRAVRSWQERHPAPVRKGRRGRIMYAVQAGTEPPAVVLFLRGGEVGPDYLRFLENRLRAEYDFTGTPLQVVGRSRRPARV